jgi:hypothetical protein
MGKPIFEMDVINGLSSELTNLLVKPSGYLYVAKSGDDTSGDGSASKPFLTIGKAITTATSGTTIFIYPGTYTESLTLKAGVNLTSSARYSVYVRGNVIANFTGAVFAEKIVFQSSSGIVMNFIGTGVQNFQALMCSFDSLSGNNSNAIDYSNTNSSSRFFLYDSIASVATSTGGAKVFSSTSGSFGSVVFDKTTCQITDNANNICLNLLGGINYTHTQDQIKGQVVVGGIANCTIAILTMQTNSVPVLVTNSTGTTTVSEVIVSTTSTPAFSGAGILVYMALIYASTGVGGASTLTGGLGAIPLAMAPIRLRAGSLTTGKNDGTFEYDGNHLYFTIGTTRNTIV